MQPVDLVNRLVNQYTCRGVWGLYEGTATHQAKLIRIDFSCNGFFFFNCTHSSTCSEGLFFLESFEMVGWMNFSLSPHGTSPRMKSNLKYIQGLATFHQVLSQAVHHQISEMSDWWLWLVHGPRRLLKSSHKVIKVAAQLQQKGPRRVAGMELKWNCDYVDAAVSHPKAERRLTAAIYAVVNQVCGNHRCEINASVIGKSIKHRGHFKQVSAGL